MLRSVAALTLLAGAHALAGVARVPARVQPVMAAVPAVTFDGTSAGEQPVELKVAKSGAYLVHRKVVTEQANMRLGTAKAKTRMEVSEIGSHAHGLLTPLSFLLCRNISAYMCLCGLASPERLSEGRSKGGNRATRDPKRRAISGYCGHRPTRACESPPSRAHFLGARRWRHGVRSPCTCRFGVAAASRTSRRALAALAVARPAPRCSSVVACLSAHAASARRAILFR
eukprot:scaffold307215_cov33-Tisochrysis_lutea.AAC.1